MRRRRSLAIVLLSAGVAAACSTVSNEPEEDTASQAQAVWNRDPSGGVVVSNDANNPVRNVVVQIPHFLADGTEDRGDTGCTGVLVTPSLVLTSKYCVSQTKGGPRAVAQIGASRDTPLVQRRSAKDAVRMPDAFVNGIDTGDLALVFLEPDTAVAFGALVPQRPSVVRPSAAAPATDGRTTFAKLEMVGWSAYTFNEVDAPQTTHPEYAKNRQRGIAEDARLWWLARDTSTGPFFARPIYEEHDQNTARVGLHAGDFGGPLYFYADRTQAARQLVGIATTSALAFEARTGELPETSCGDGQCDVWMDLTFPSARDWIGATAADRSHDTLPNWNVAHRRTDVPPRANGVADWWYGESDANGAVCDRSKDTDCDGWFDKNPDGTKRDNCTDVPNPGQEDTDDDGLGDACNGCGANQGGDACNTGRSGVCAPGIRRCRDGALACVGNVAASPETCDGLDNDCDGNVDNADPGGGANCSTGKNGVCGAGTLHCQAGAIKCVQNTQPSAETCDGVDNDCDGTVDNNNPGGGAACSTGFPGACAAGTTQCLTGVLRCKQTTPASVEACDGIDNDCDGTVDNGDPGGGAACATGQKGVCAAGTRHCRNGAVACERNSSPFFEIPCDGLDNDCDGATDEWDGIAGIQCGTGRPGQCSAGFKSCNGTTPICSPVHDATAEVCDGIDNNCNGTVDEGAQGVGTSCTLSGCTVATKKCSGGALSCTCDCHAIPKATACRGQCGEVVDNGCGGSWVCPRCPGGPGGGACGCACCQGRFCAPCQDF
jgi:hypothetical protein